MKVDKEKEVLRDQLADVQKRVGKGEAEEVRFKAEVFTLNMIINEADAERLKQQKEYETVLSERDVLGTQLIKRNDELGGLYEKIKVQQSTLNAGQRAYAERVEDTQALHVDIAALRSELAVLKASVQNIDLLRHEALQLNREVLHERTKVRALSEELDQQMNVHRWRKLEGSDPATYSMIQRAHALQKTLIRKTEEVASKDQLIQEKEKLYVELKAILARQPGPEVAEQLTIYQSNLSEKQKQMKAMTSELSMHREQVSDLQLDAWGPRPTSPTSPTHPSSPPTGLRPPARSRGPRDAEDADQARVLRPPPAPPPPAPAAAGLDRRGPLRRLHRRRLRRRRAAARHRRLRRLRRRRRAAARRRGAVGRRRSARQRRRAAAGLGMREGAEVSCSGL